MIERECKIPVASRLAVNRRLEALGAVFRGGGREDNLIYDTDDDALRGRGVLLRLRTVAGRPGGVLTVKGRALDGAFKTREEWETRVDDPGQLALALAALGYRPRRRYQKDRDEWTWGDVHIAVDDFPLLGAFVEVEGGEESIRRALAELGLDPAAHRPENYLKLWDDHLAARGEPPRDAVF